MSSTAQPAPALKPISKLLSLAQNLFKRQEKPIVIPHTNQNVIIITAFPKKRIITVSYKGQDRRALLDDDSLRNMVHGRDYDKNSLKVFQTVATLLLPLTKK
jgi:hypothetical protein